MEQLDVLMAIFGNVVTYCYYGCIKFGSKLCGITGG